MITLTGKAAEFLALHKTGEPLLQPNAFDAGSARILEAMGFAAIATTSSGFAGTLGRHDGNVTRDEVLRHCRDLSAAVTIPVAADYENGFADDPGDVGTSVRDACGTGLAGVSIEDWSGNAIYDKGLAVERIAAAAEAAHNSSTQVVLTARAENLIRGVTDLGDTIGRLQAYQEAGADVLFAPGLRTVDDVRTVVSSVDRPVNVLVLAGCPTVAEVAEAGAARVSIGGALMYVAYAALIDAASEFKEQGTHGYWSAAGLRRDLVRGAFT